MKFNSNGSQARGKAQLLAEKLISKGCSFSYVVEPRQDTPGRVQINDQIYVEVTIDNDLLFVVLKHPDGTLDYGRARKRIAYVQKDISCATYQGSPRP